MKLLLDANLSDRLVNRLKGVYSEIAHVKTLGLAHNTPDEVIWAWAKKNNFVIIVTQDVDFVYLLEKDGPPPKVIRLRFGNQRNADIADFFKLNHDVFLEFADNEEKALLEIFSIR